MDQANVAIVSAQLNAWLAEQKWWQRSANTVTTFVGGALVLAWWIASTWADAPQWLSTVIGALGFAATVLGVKMTTNGMTPSTVEGTIDRLTDADPQA